MQPAVLTIVTKIARLLNLLPELLKVIYASKVGNRKSCLLSVAQSSSVLSESELSVALDSVIVPAYTPAYPDRVTLLPDPLENVTVACRLYSVSRALSSSISS